MDRNEFNLVLLGEGQNWTDDGSTRLRYIVEEGASELAGELRKAGRPDRASRMAYIGSQLRVGNAISKKVARKASKDLDTLRERVVDGEPDSSPPYR